MIPKQFRSSWFILGFILLCPLALLAQEETVEDEVLQPDEEVVAGADDEVVAEEQPAEEEGIEEEEGIFLNAQDVDIQTLLQQLSQMQRINLVATKDVTGSVTISLYGVTLEQALDAILVPNGYAYKKKDTFYYIMKADDLQAVTWQPRPMEVQIYQLSYLHLEDAKELLKIYLSKDGLLQAGNVSPSGIQSGSMESGGESNSADNFMVIKDYPEVHETIALALETLDVRPKQVLVEATIIEVTLDDHNRLGVNFNALGGVDFSELGAETDLTGIDTGTAGGPLIDDTFNAFGTRGFTDTQSSQGFSLGILKSDLAIFIEALESVTDTNVLANPKVLALNRQRAEIIIGGRLGYFGTETLTETGFSQQQVEFLNVGTQLRFRPFIGEDQYIRLEIHPQRSDGVVDSVTGLPSETTSEVTTNILVKDGDTIVIGGLIEERDSMTIAQVPFLGSLPGIGWLFRKEETATKRSEIIILITPRIIEPSEDNSDAEEMIEDYAGRKHAFRETFHVYTRTLRADTHVEEARRALESGKVSMVNYHLWWAERLNPHESDITELRGELAAYLSRNDPQSNTLEEYLWSEVK